MSVVPGQGSSESVQGGGGCRVLDSSLLLIWRGKWSSEMIVTF